MSIFKRFAAKRQERLNQKRQELFLRVRDIAVKLLKIQDIEKIKPQTRFKEDLNIDSLDALELIMELESFFGFEIPDEDAERLFTIQDIVNYLEKKL